MVPLSILSEETSYRFGIEPMGLELVQRNPLEANLPLVWFFSHSHSGAVLQGTREHELDLMHLGILGEFVVFADVFPQADEVSDGDVNGEFLATFSPQGIGEQFAGILPTAGQYVEQTFLILELDGEETLVCDNDGFGRISDRVHCLLLLIFSMGQSNGDMLLDCETGCW
jgi:hypothetical protein